MDPRDGALPAYEFRSHRGEESIYVLEGGLRLWIGGGIYELNPGDSTYFF